MVEGLCTLKEVSLFQNGLKSDAFEIWWKNFMKALAVTEKIHWPDRTDPANKPK